MKTTETNSRLINRSGERQPQGRRTVLPDLFEFAYVPDWYGQLAELEEMALPESWKFKKPSHETKNTDTPILERYIHTIFRKQAIDFNCEEDFQRAGKIFHLENECACFHTGLYTRQYKGIYAYFERNTYSDFLRNWYFRGFCDEMSPKLRYIEPLPQKPVYYMAQSGINFNPAWPIRVNVNHILGDAENLERIPVRIRKAKNLPLLLETAVELGRRKAIIESGIIVPQGYMTCGDGEWGAEVYGCASDRQQASIVFDVAVDMVDQCPALKKRIKPVMSVKRLVYKPTNSFYQVLSAEAYTKHGLNVHAVIFDELHGKKLRILFPHLTC